MFSGFNLDLQRQDEKIKIVVMTRWDQKVVLRKVSIPDYSL